MFRKITHNWKLMWLLQLTVMLIVSLFASYLPLCFPSAVLVLRIIFLWFLPSLVGAWTACMLTRSGLTAYASWFLPPLIHSAVPWLLIGYPPSAASMLVCAFVSLVGAAVGDVLYRRDHA